MDIPASSVSHLMAGRNKPGYEFIYKIIQRFPRLNPDWLIVGSGPMYRQPQGATPPAQVNVASGQAAETGRLPETGDARATELDRHGDATPSRPADGNITTGRSTSTPAESPVGDTFTPAGSLPFLGVEFGGDTYITHNKAETPANDSTGAATGTTTSGSTSNAAGYVNQAQQPVNMANNETTRYTGTGESHNAMAATAESRKFPEAINPDSSGKSIERIVIFFNNSTFTSFIPEK